MRTVESKRERIRLSVSGFEPDLGLTVGLSTQSCSDCICSRTSLIRALSIPDSPYNKFTLERVPYTKSTWHPVYKPYGTGLKNCFIENACIRSLLKWTFLTCNWFLGTDYQRGKWEHFVYGTLSCTLNFKYAILFNQTFLFLIIWGICYNKITRQFAKSIQMTSLAKFHCITTWVHGSLAETFRKSPLWDV